jgi:glucan phosphoethanolaminetransferase (alkaline phosphatase superfamily)
MNLISLLTAFVPWIAFSLIAESPTGNPLMGLTLAFIVAIVLTVLTSYRQIIGGYILSVITIVFFIVFFILIIGLQQYSLANYLSVLSMLILTVVCWATMLFRFPFTLQYSREGVDPERAKSAPFMRVNYIITAVWGIAFTLGMAIDAFLLVRPDPGLLFWDNLKWVFMIIAIVFTVWYPAYVHKQRALQEIANHPDLLKRFGPAGSGEQSGLREENQGK